MDFADKNQIVEKSRVPRFTTGPKLCDGQNSSSELIFILSKGFILTKITTVGR